MSNGRNGAGKQQKEEDEVKEEDAQHKEEESKTPESPVKRSTRSSAGNLMPCKLINISVSPLFFSHSTNASLIIFLYGCVTSIQRFIVLNKPYNQNEHKPLNVS